MFDVISFAFRHLLFNVKVRKESPQTLVGRLLIAVVIFLFSRNASFFILLVRYWEMFDLVRYANCLQNVFILVYVCRRERFVFLV